MRREGPADPRTELVARLVEKRPSHRALTARELHADKELAVLEIGDIDRFSHPSKLCSWAGLTPRHPESDSKVHRGPITKQGCALVRWAAIEAISRFHGGPPIVGHYRRVAERRGNNVARVAAAGKLLTLIYYGLRDGEIRCLHNDAA